MDESDTIMLHQPIAEPNMTESDNSDIVIKPKNRDAQLVAESLFKEIDRIVSLSILAKETSMNLTQLLEKFGLDSGTFGWDRNGDLFKYQRGGRLEQAENVNDVLSLLL